MRQTNDGVLQGSCTLHVNDCLYRYDTEWLHDRHTDNEQDGRLSLARNRIVLCYVISYVSIEQ